MHSLQTADGRRLTYEREGSGPVLVCHPGGPGFSSLCFGDLAGLTEHVTLIKLNPRGTSASHRPEDPRAYATEDYAADVEELRVHLGLERMLLFGHSHGGLVAQLYAALHPERVDRLVLASTLARFPAEQEEAMVAAMDAKSGEPWYRDARAALEAEQAGDWDTDEDLGELAFREFPFYFAHYGEAEAAYLESLRKEIPVGDALRLFNEEIFHSFDLRSKLARITAPTLVITGEEDFITGPLAARELAQEIPRAKLVLLPDCGHFLFVEQPEGFAQAVTAFLTNGVGA